MQNSSPSESVFLDSSVKTRSAIGANSRLLRFLIVAIPAFVRMGKPNIGRLVNIRSRTRISLLSQRRRQSDFPGRAPNLTKRDNRLICARILFRRHLDGKAGCERYHVYQSMVTAAPVDISHRRQSRYTEWR